MNTPVCDFVENYIKKTPLRLHMPGHKGAFFTGAEERDLTEIDGADVLYKARGVIAESEENASRLFGSGKTVYSCEGSSLCIRAMLYLAVLYANEKSRGIRGGEEKDNGCIGAKTPDDAGAEKAYGSGKNGAERPLIFAARNAHRVFLSAAALLDFDVTWLYGDEDFCDTAEETEKRQAAEKRADGVISCGVSARGVRKKLEEAFRAGRLPAAVYVTSPDYLGNIADIKGIAAVCREYGVLCLTDNAHGAYLKFCEKSLHPMDLGADMCCDSAHKTLPVLTGGAYLHISKNAPAVLKENAERAMGLFASTSPSYLILQSLDKANAVIEDTGYRRDLAVFSKRAGELKKTLEAAGYGIAGDEPMKITLRTKTYGYTGEEVKDYLAAKNIICEFADEDYIVFMFTPFLEEDCFARLSAALLALPSKEKIRKEPPVVLRKKSVMSVRQAAFSPSEALPVKECLGRVLAAENVSCPPAVPIVACGEEIDENALALFEYYKEEYCRVVK